MQGKIISDKGYPILERGFCYTTTGQTPTVEDQKIPVGEGLGSFSYNVNLPSGKYYFRTYAINEAGAGYSYSYKEVVVP